MAVHKYITCSVCTGIGIVPIHPPEEWSPETEKHFVICQVCHGLGRVKQVEARDPEKAEAAGSS